MILEVNQKVLILVYINNYIFMVIIRMFTLLQVLRYENSPLRCARIPVNTEEEAVRVELKMKTGMMKEINHLTERNRGLYCV